jgi:uncharacterized protein YndB with AHSA1/START domain
VATLRLTQVIERPAEDVFATIVDAGNFASWNPTIESSRQLSEGPPGSGTRVEWVLSGFGKVEQELQEVEPNRRVRIVPQMKAMSGGHRFTLTPESDRGTRVDHELEMTPRGFFKVMGPMMTRTGRRNLTATADALKRHLEEASS